MKKAAGGAKGFLKAMILSCDKITLNGIRLNSFHHLRSRVLSNCVCSHCHNVIQGVYVLNQKTVSGLLFPA